MTERLPTVGGDIGAWGTVLNGYLGVGHNSDGTNIVFPSTASVRYVDPTYGSDSNAGLSPTNAYATIGSAYTSLPADGGTMILLPGTHNVGAGVTMTYPKYASITSVNGFLPEYDSPPTPATCPVLTGTGSFIFKITASASQIANGWSFSGLAFDLRGDTDTVSGILAIDTNHVRVFNCTCDDTGSKDSYFVRSTQPSFDDGSWFRIENNRVRLVGLCSLNDGKVSGNCNNNQIINNVIFGAPHWGVKISNSQRSLVMGNNFEGSIDGCIRWMNTSRYNYTVFNSGEGVQEPFLQYDDGSVFNVHFNWGTHYTGDVGAEVNVNDDHMEASPAATGNTMFAERALSVHGIETGDFTLSSLAWSGGMKDVNKATAVTMTLDTHANKPIPLGSHIKIRQVGAGQVTVSPAGGVTLQSKANGYKTSAQYGVINLMKVDINKWAMWGDTTT